MSAVACRIAASFVISAAAPLRREMSFVWADLPMWVAIVLF